MNIFENTLNVASDEWRRFFETGNFLCSHPGRFRLSTSINFYSFFIHFEVLFEHRSGTFILRLQSVQDLALTGVSLWYFAAAAALLGIYPFNKSAGKIEEFFPGLLLMSFGSFMSSVRPIKTKSS